jgi:hypothetical protein
MKYFLIAAVVAISTTAVAVPPSGVIVDPDTAQWYQSLRQPKTELLCCNIADCRPTDLRRSPDKSTEWQAYISKEIYGPDAPDIWMNIPADKILDHETNPTGRVVICWYQNQIYCAVLPSLT